MTKGVVKWFNPTKRFGFIEPTDGGRDVFVHLTSVKQAGLQSLDEGQKVNYEVAMKDGRSSVVSIELDNE